MIQIRTVYLGIACGLFVAIGAGGTLYYARHGAHPAVSSTAASGDASNQLLAVSPARSVHTVAWYEAHPDQIKEKLAACNNTPGTAMHDPECYNAGTAKENDDLDHFINSAPKDAQPIVPHHR